MADTTNSESKSGKKPVAKPAGFDRGPQDFFRGSRGSQFNNKGNNRSFIGMRRGSR